MKNSLWILFLFFFCGTAYALSQDWPCFGIEVKKYKTIYDSENEFEYAYQGENSGYILNIHLSGFHQIPSLFADCGNAGCFGTITEKASSRTEGLNFFCEKYTDDYMRVTCYVSFGPVAIFDKADDGGYVVHYCKDNMQKTLRFNLADCKRCHCMMYWYDDEVKNTIGQYQMACKKEDDKARCFTYYGYEVWRNFENKDDDFQNCVGLKW